MKARSLNPGRCCENLPVVSISDTYPQQNTTAPPPCHSGTGGHAPPPPTLSRGGGGVNPLLEQCKEICSERDGGDTCYQRGSTPNRR